MDTHINLGEDKMIKAYPKIFQIGTDYIKDIFDGEVEVTEKIDGSQFVFGKINNELFMRSKNKQLFTENPEGMFIKAIEYVLSIQDEILNNMIFYCEYLKKPKHNTLCYDEVPKNNLICFGISTPSDSFYKHANQCYTGKLGLDYVPILYEGKVESVDKLKELLETESVLGGTKIEGVVIKNYNKPFLLGGQPIPVMAGKFVSEVFKEKMRGWGEEHTGKGKWEIFKDSYRTEARWQKSIQHLRDNGELENVPKDIGALIKEIHRDITEEEKEIIKDFLWKEFGKELLRKSTVGFPEWYKEQLLNRSFENE
jgi:hypothetical protein